MKKIGLFIRILVSIQGVLIGDYLSRSLRTQHGNGEASRQRGTYAIAFVDKGKVIMGAKPSQLLFAALSALLVAPLFPRALLGAFFSGIGTGLATDILYGDMSDREMFSALQGK